MFGPLGTLFCVVQEEPLYSSVDKVFEGGAYGELAPTYPPKPRPAVSVPVKPPPPNLATFKAPPVVQEDPSYSCVDCEYPLVILSVPEPPDTTNAVCTPKPPPPASFATGILVCSDQEVPLYSSTSALYGGPNPPAIIPADVIPPTKECFFL